MKLLDYLVFSTAHPHVGDKGNPDALCAMFTDRREQLSPHQKTCLSFPISDYFRHPLLGYAPSTAVPNKQGDPVSFAVCLFVFSSIHMILGCLLAHFFPRLKHKWNKSGAFTKPAPVRCIPLCRSRASSSLRGASAWGGGWKAFAYEMYQKLGIPLRPVLPTSLPPPSADEERGPIGRQRERRERGEQSISDCCGTTDLSAHWSLDETRNKPTLWYFWSSSAKTGWTAENIWCVSHDYFK